MAERTEGVNMLQLPLGSGEPEDGVSQDEVDDGEDEEPAAVPLVV